MPSFFFPAFIQQKIACRTSRSTPLCETPNILILPEPGCLHDTGVGALKAYVLTPSDLGRRFSIDVALRVWNHLHKIHHASPPMPRRLLRDGAASCARQRDGGIQSGDRRATLDSDPKSETSTKSSGAAPLRVTARLEALSKPETL
jgi:hypothetical protein